MSDAPVKARRQAAQAMRDLVKTRLPKVVYALAWWIRGKGQPGGNDIAANTWGWRAGLDIDWNAGFWHQADLGGTGGSPRYVFRPHLKSHVTEPSDPAVIFSDFSLSGLSDVKILPATTTPVGKPSGTSYTLDNARPDPDEREFDRESFDEDQTEKSFGWLVSLEFQQSLKTHAGILGAGTEISAELRQRVEAHGDKRWTHTASIRKALRGRFAVSAWGRFQRTRTEQLVELSQSVLVTGKLDCRITLTMHGAADIEFPTFDALANTLRGLGGPGWMGSYFSWQDPSVDDRSIPESEIEAKLVRPSLLLDVGPKAVRLLRVSDEQSEVPIPGKEAEYKAARAGGTNRALDVDLATGPEEYAPAGLSPTGPPSSSGGSATTATPSAATGSAASPRP